jgi:phenylacetate-CoA ligase
VTVSARPESTERTRLDRLNALLELARESNAFQRPRLPARPLDSLDELERIPLASKEMLVADQEAHPPYGTNLSFPAERFTQIHRTSGTRGPTLFVLNTAEDWAWWRRCMARVLVAAGIGPGDRVALTYSFGPYLLYWASYDGVDEAGAARIGMGGMDSLQRLDALREFRATAVLCTPTYAVHLAQVAAQHGQLDAFETVERLVCSGEPGASIPAVRARLEAAWSARCFDHAGLSEVGAATYPCSHAGGLHVLEDEFIAEIIDAKSATPVADGEVGELVLTAVGRLGSPAIRYRTGDVVDRHDGPCPAGHRDRWLPRGILARSDDMVVIRGMNVFPSAIEQTMREVAEIGEFRITFYTETTAMDEVKIEVELERAEDVRAIQASLRRQLGLRVRIVPLKPGILPTSTDKARRVVDLRAR